MKQARFCLVRNRTGQAIAPRKSTIGYRSSQPGTRFPGPRLPWLAIQAFQPANRARFAFQSTLSPTPLGAMQTGPGAHPVKTGQENLYRITSMPAWPSSLLHPPAHARHTRPVNLNTLRPHANLNAAPTRAWRFAGSFSRIYSNLKPGLKSQLTLTPHASLLTLTPHRHTVKVNAPGGLAGR